MKTGFCIILLIISGCTKSQPTLEVVAIQHVGKGIMNGDACKTLYREDNDAVISPTNFKITPYEAVKIANEKLGYSCGNKLGAQILADKEHYYIVRLGNVQDAIVISGADGSIVSSGFMEKKE